MSIDKEIGNVFFPYKIIAYPEILAKLAKEEETAPINLEINLTNRCNHNCVWCTYGYLHSNGDSLDTQKIAEVLRCVAEMGLKSVTWTGGGEPTVHKDFFSLIQFADSLGLKQGLNTNGYLLTDEMIRFLAKRFSYVRFSVDAGRAETLERCHRTNKQDFDRIQRNIRSLCEQKRREKGKVVVGYSFLVDSMNYQDIEVAAVLAKDLGVDYIQYKPIVHYDSDNKQFDRGADIWPIISSAFDKVKQMQCESFDVHILNHKFENIQLAQENYGRRYQKCYGCNVLASVGANGSVDFCCAYKGFSDWSAGNIYESSFRDIWFGKKRREMRESVDIRKCPPMCKADEINRLINFIQTYSANKEFV